MKNCNAINVLAYGSFRNVINKNGFEMDDCGMSKVHTKLEALFSTLVYKLQITLAKNKFVCIFRCRIVFIESNLRKLAIVCKTLRLINITF